MSVAVADLITDLRMRLNDADAGAYSTSEIQQAILIALRDTEALTRCNLVAESMETVIGQAAYTFSVFEPLELSYNGVPLTKRTVPDMIAQYGTSTFQDGTPDAYAVTSGGTVRLSPVPTAVGTLVMHGYGTSTTLGTYITTVPESVASQIITTRAEMLLRMWRPTVSGNIDIAGALGQLYQSLIGMVTR